jgi:hypothetical protein
MFEKLTAELLNLRVTRRGTPAVGNALRHLCIFAALAFLVLVPVAAADTRTTTTSSPAGQNPAVASTTPQQQYWVAPGSGGPVTVHFDYVSRDAICADTLSIFKVDSADGAINGTLPGDPAWPAQMHPQMVFSSSSSSPGASADLTFQGGDILAFAFDGCGGRDYSYVAANPAGQTFVLTSEDATGAWTLAWEDGGDFDYNDLVVSVTGLLGGADPTAGTGSGDVPATDFAYAGGCSSTSTASAASACAQLAECKGANTRWGVANGHATWTNLFRLVMWRYYATVRVCIDIKHNSILAYDSETSEAADVFKPVWSYDNNPRWDVGPVGMKVQQSWVRVTDSFTGCPILGVPIGCNHEVFSITFNVNGAGSYTTTDRFN